MNVFEVIGSSGDVLTVTTFPANHVTGALMFLFEWNYKGVRQSVMHTGDFRFTESMLEWRDRFRSRPDIDTLILDTTFVAPQWETFALKEESVDMILCLIALKFEENPRARIFLGCDNIGFEPMFEAIHDVFKQRICVPRLLLHILENTITASHDDYAEDDEERDARNVREFSTDRTHIKYVYRGPDRRLRHVYTVSL